VDNYIRFKVQLKLPAKISLGSVKEVIWSKAKETQELEDQRRRELEKRREMVRSEYSGLVSFAKESATKVLFKQTKTQPAVITEVPCKHKPYRVQLQLPTRLENDGNYLQQSEAKQESEIRQQLAKIEEMMPQNNQSLFATSKLLYESP
jgi:hypothetical protein